MLFIVNYYHIILFFHTIKIKYFVLKYLFYSMYTIIIAFIIEFDFEFNKIILFLVKIIKY